MTTPFTAIAPTVPQDVRMFARVHAVNGLLVRILDVVGNPSKPLEMYAIAEVAKSDRRLQKSDGRGLRENDRLILTMRTSTDGPFPKSDPNHCVKEMATEGLKGTETLAYLSGASLVNDDEAEFSSWHAVGCAD